MPAALVCQSNFSFLEGASHPEELVDEAHRLGLSALALTDRDGVYGVVRAHVRARELGLPLVIGASVTVAEPRGSGEIVLLAADRAGYANLCTLLTIGRRRVEKGRSEVRWDEVCAHAPGLVALWRGDGPPAVGGDLRDAFGDRLYALLTRHLAAGDADTEAALRARVAPLDVPLVATTHVLYHSPARRPLQDVLTCIRHGVTLHTAGRHLRPNAEHGLRTPHALAQLFADEPRALARTDEVAARCRFSLAEIRYRYPAERMPVGLTTQQHLRELTFEGARGRYGGTIPADVAVQLERELEVIDALDYGGYFLTMVELVRFCHQENILCQGRGSAANSAVCYCLGITAVDPVRMELLFERFLSRERAEPPDIDLDVEHERREEVIQHLYAKHGRSHAAMVANVIRYRARSALRDVGKALGLAETDLDRVARLIHHHHDGLDAARLAAGGLDASAELTTHLLRLANELEGFPRHLSIHPGGFLLGHEPVSTLVPIENATMADRTVIQWDKDDVEALGLFKVDVLALGALSHLHRCFDMVRATHGVDLSMATLPAGDAPTYDAICAGDTVGVFQIESRAQMSMLPRLQPRCYYDIVIQVSIVRPGPITGGMVHPYLRRRAGTEDVEYPHPSLEPVLARTLGVPLFQEQVMRIAVVAADYTPGEADQLRRDMAAWRHTGRIEAHRERLISRMQKKGITAEFAERVFNQIRGFGEYGFPESHAASFALVSYAGSYLKTHYPGEFTASLLNALPMGFYSAATIVEDARRHGVRILPVDAQLSGWDCSATRRAGGAPSDVRMGLRLLKGFREADAARLAAAAPYEDARDLATRSGLDARALDILAKAGALDGLRVARREALWQVRGVAAAQPVPLAAIDDEPAPRLAPLSRLETITWDLAAASHSALGHPLGELRGVLGAHGLPSARALAQLPDGTRTRYAGLVICRQRPGTASGVTFMTLEDETGFVNVVLWERIFAAHAVLGRTQGFLGVAGKLQVQDGVVHLVADALFVPELGTAPLPPEATSRDFH